MCSAWLRSRLTAMAAMALFAVSIAVIGLVSETPAQARGGGGFGGGRSGGGFSRSDGFGDMSQSRTNVYASHTADYNGGGARPGGYGYGPDADRNVNVTQNYNVNGGGWGYGWGGDGVGAAIAGATAGAVAGATEPAPCDPYYYGSEVYCD